MEKLNKRQKKFLEMLLQETDYIPVQTFADRLGVSAKTLKEDVKLFRSVLAEYSGEILTKTGKGVRLTKKTCSNMELRNFLREKEKEKDSGAGERRAEIIKNMLIHSEQYISLQKLSEQYFVGKSSIVNDFKYIEEWLRQYQISLEKTKFGTRIAGRERDIREAITALLYEDFLENSKSEKIDFNGLDHLDRDTVQNLLEIFKPQDIVFVMTLLEELQVTEALDTSDIYYKNLLTHILICIQRVRDGKSVKEQKEAVSGKTDYGGYYSAIRISDRIKEQYNIDIGEEETYYIYQYICSLTTPGEITGGFPGEKESLPFRFAEKLTEYMTEILDVKFVREEMLMEGLLLHIRPMINRLEYHIKITNPLLCEIRENYPQMLGICKIACAMVCRQLQLDEISIDEIANLATYYQTMLVKQTEPVNVVVVCHSGYGTSQLLKVMLRQQFPDLNIRDVISLRKLRQIDFDKTDLILSTVPVGITPVPHLLVSSFLTDKDISAIRNSIYKITQHEKKSVERLTKTLARKIVSSDSEEKEGKELFVRADLTEKTEIRIWNERKKTGYLSFLEDKAKKSIKIDIFSQNDTEISSLLSDIYCLWLDGDIENEILESQVNVGIQNILLRKKEERYDLTGKSSLLKLENILLNQKAESKEEVISTLIKQLRFKENEKGEEEVRKAVQERELLGFTGIGKRVALVHAVTNAVPEVNVVFLRLLTPVDWAPGRDYPEETRMIILAVLLLVPPQLEKEEVRAVKDLVLKLGHGGIVKSLLEAQTRQEVTEILRGGVKNDYGEGNSDI